MTSEDQHPAADPGAARPVDEQARDGQVRDDRWAVPQQSLPRWEPGAARTGEGEATPAAAEAEAEALDDTERTRPTPTASRPRYAPPATAAQPTTPLPTAAQPTTPLPDGFDGSAQAASASQPVQTVPGRGPAVGQPYPGPAAAGEVGMVGLDGAGGAGGNGTDAYASHQEDGGHRQHGPIGRVVAVSALVAALVGGGAGAAIGWASGHGSSTTVSSTSGSNVVINDPEHVTDVTAGAAKASPSVVTISASSSSESGTGSGVILDAQGRIVTNNHVVTLDGATSSATLKVTLSDGSVYDATTVGLDSTTDLAVIQLKNPPSNLTAIEFADSSKLNVGDTAIAIGAPQGLENTVTSGVVSALNRAISLDSSAAQDGDSSTDEGNGYDFWNDFGSGGSNGYGYGGQSGSQSTQSDSSIYLSVVQTDAAINPGNSGGPLVNTDGQLIGVNVAIATATSSTGQSTSNGSIGLGFAIPAKVVQRVTGELISDGKAQHGQLGATVSSATGDDGVTGALVKDVTSGGPAAQAGLKSGDIITKVDGVRITSASHLIGTVRQSGPGTAVTVEYVRDGKTQSVQVTLEAASE